MYFLILVYIILLVIRPQDYPIFAESAHWPIQQSVLILAGVAWMFSERKSFSAPQYLLLLMFFVVLMFSKAVNGWTGGMVYVAAIFAPVVLTLTLLSHAVDSRGRMLNVMAVLVLCAGVLALHGILQAANGIGWTGVELSQETRIQYVGIFNDPNDLGLLFVMCLPMAFYLGSRGGLMGLRRLLWFGIAAMLVYGIYLTDSRGTLLAMLVVLGVYVWRKRGVFVAGIMGSAALMGLMMMPSRLQNIDVSEDSALGRVDSWYEGMQMFIENPVFGVGAGNYTDYNRLTAHNSLVLVLAETGFLGFTIWLAFIGYSLWMMLWIVRKGDMAFIDNEGEDSDLLDDWMLDRGISFTLLLSMCGFFAAAFFLSRSYTITLYLLIALVIAQYQCMRTRYPWLAQPRLGNGVLYWPAVSACTVVVLFVVVKVLLGMA